MVETPKHARDAQFGSIGTRFSVGLIAIITAVLVCFAVVAIFINSKRAQDQLATNLQNNLRLSEFSLRVPLWNVDYLTAQGVLDALLQDDEVLAAKVVSNSEIVGKSFRNKADEDAGFEELAKREDVTTGSLDVVYQGETLANLQIAMSRSSIKETVRLNAIGIVGLIILIIAAIASTTVFLFRRYVSRPLRNLQKSASAIADGDVSVAIDVERADEIGLLAQDFDTMRSSIKRLIRDLQDANTGLEQRVVERTTESREATRRLTDAIESISEGFVFYDAEDKLVISNSRYKELLYEGADLDLSPGQTFEDMLRTAVGKGIFPDAMEDPENWIMVRLGQHENPGEPMLQYRENGRWVLVSERKVAGGGTVAVYSDLTDLKQRELEAEESQARLQAILDYAPSLVVVKDLEGKYLLCNEAFEFFWGQTSEEVVGKTDSDLFDEELADLYLSTDREVIASREAITFEDAQDFGGEQRIGVVSKFPLLDREGNVYAVCSITSDVTEIKNREAELKRTSDRLDLALSMEGIGIWNIDLKSEEAWWSDQYILMMGHNPEKFSATINSWEEHLHPEDSARTIKLVDAFLESGESALRIAQHMIRPDGSELWTEAMMHVERDENNKPVRLTGIDVDTSERHLKEEQLRTTTAEIYQKNQELVALSSKLSKYLSPQVYDSIFTGRQDVKIASTRKKLTVFFSDLVGFTETTEKLESEELTHLLNRYLTEMSQVALDHGATIDKYVGDAIVIFFGDPQSLGTKEDAVACVTMALAMQEKMQSLKKSWRSEGIEYPLQCRMGISTAFCTVGNFGSEDRMDYTIIGGGVNLASRLESSADPGDILISYETYALIRDQIDCEPKGKIEVKGIEKPVSVFSVKGNPKIPGKGSEGFIRAFDDNYSIDVDVNSLSARESESLAAKLEEIVHQLKSKKP